MGLCYENKDTELKRDLEKNIHGTQGQAVIKQDSSRGIKATSDD